MSALAIDSSVDIMIGEETSEAASIAAEFSEAVEQSLVYGGLLSEMAPPNMWQAGGSSSSEMWQGVSPQLGLCRRCRQSYTLDSPTFRRWWTPFCPQERHNFFNVDKRKTRTNDWFSFKSDNPTWWKKGQDFHLWWMSASPEQKDAWHRFCKTSERDHFKTPER